MHKHYFLPKVAAIEPYIRSFSSSSAKSFHILKILPTFLPSKKKKNHISILASHFLNTPYITLFIFDTLQVGKGVSNPRFFRWKH